MHIWPAYSTLLLCLLNIYYSSHQWPGTSPLALPFLLLINSSLGEEFFLWEQIGEMIQYQFTVKISLRLLMLAIEHMK